VACQLLPKRRPAFSGTDIVDFGQDLIRFARREQPPEKKSNFVIPFAHHMKTAPKRNFKVILFIESSRGSGRDYLRGVARYAHLHGNWSFYWEPGGLEITRQKLKTLDADGIMLRDVGALTMQASRLGIPAVVLGHRDQEVRGLINVVTDSEVIGGMAADHLMRCGFKHFAYCGLARGVREQTPWSQLRQKFFCEHVTQAGHQLPPVFVLPPPGSDWNKIRRRLADWLLALSHPLGLMACNDDCGAQVAEACKLAGLAVPEAVGIVGVDNDEVVCGLADPAMSSVAVNFERAGYQAAEALDRLMRKSNKVPSKIQALASYVVARRSTDVMAVEDASLEKALACIRNRAGSPLTVNEVARAAGISRRALERRFRHQLGNSVLQAIRHQRTDQIARLLLETNLPVTRIAESLGFADAQHFARYFRSAKKMSPLAFRKAHK
jgi:LacI family transcriptional regulator